MIIKAHFDNGDSITTTFNGTAAEAIKHYINNNFVFGNGEGPETITTCRAIEFLEGAPVKHHAGKVYGRLKRVYSISDAYKLRHGLNCSIRQTWGIHRSISEHYTEDYAYNGI